MPNNNHNRLHHFAGRWNWRCFYCDRKTHCGRCRPEADQRLRATREHRIPRARGGKNLPNNKVLACRECNSAKGASLDLERKDWLSVAAQRRTERNRRRIALRTGGPVWRACAEGWCKSEQQATDAVRTLLAATGKTFESYRCKFCKHWHLQPVEDSEADLAG